MVIGGEMITLRNSLGILSAAFVLAGCAGLHQSEQWTSAVGTHKTPSSLGSPILLGKSPSGLVIVWIEQASMVRSCESLPKVNGFSTSTLSQADSLVK
jgi:hypothetical protein